MFLDGRKKPEYPGENMRQPPHFKSQKIWGFLKIFEWESAECFGAGALQQSVVSDLKQFYAVFRSDSR